MSEPCRDNNLTNMDTLELYGIENSETVLKPIKIGDHRSAGLEDLDPSLELAVDLSEYITANVTQDDLFPDIFQQNQPAATQKIVYTDLPQQMPHIIEPSEYLLERSNGVKIEPQDELSTFGLNYSNLLAAQSLIYPEDLQSPAGSDVAYSEISSTISPAPSPAPQQSYKAPSSKSRRKTEVKESDEYKDRRSRNNIAVRKSRDKAKLRQMKTEDRVQDLTTQNDQLQKKVDLLSKELTVLKGLFSNVGGGFPAEYNNKLQDLLSQ